MATIEIKDGELVVHIHGWDKLLALRSTLTVPLSAVRGAVARPADAEYDKMKGLRLAGGYWPGSFAAGYFWVTGGVGGDVQRALERLESARDEIDPGVADDPGGHLAEARGHLGQAILAVKKALEAAKVPEHAKYLAFYDVHDPDRTIGLDVDHGRLKRVVVQLDDESPGAAVARILAAIGRGAA